MGLLKGETEEENPQGHSNIKEATKGNEPTSLGGLVVKSLGFTPQGLGFESQPCRQGLLCERRKGVTTPRGPYLLNGASEPKSVFRFGPMV